MLETRPEDKASANTVSRVTFGSMPAQYQHYNSIQVCSMVSIYANIFAKMLEWGTNRGIVYSVFTYAVKSYAVKSLWLYSDSRANFRNKKNASCV